MNIDKFKHQHLDILRSIDLLRQLTHAGVERNAAEISQRIVAMSSTIKLHLAVEDQALYPALQRSGNAGSGAHGPPVPERHGPDRQRLRRLCAPLEPAESLRADEKGFRAEANVVLRKVYERMQREDRDFYPRIEEQEAVHA